MVALLWSDDVPAHAEDGDAEDDDDDDYYDGYNVVIWWPIPSLHFAPRSILH